MDLLLFSVGSVGFIAALIFLIVSFVRKKPKYKSLIALGIFFVLFITGLFMPSSSNDTETINENSKLTKANVKILQKDFDELDSDERTRLITMQSDMDVEELKEHKSDLKRLYIQEMAEAYGSERAGEKFEEDFDYEIRKRKGELTEEEKAEDKKIEEEAKKFIAESQSKSRIEEAIVSVVGETNNMDEESISKIDINDNYGTEEDGGKLIIANINASENATNNMTRKAILMDTAKIFENLFDVGSISEVTLNWDYPLVDKYGNEEIDTILKITIDKEISKDVNWENFNYNDFNDISKEYWEHPSLIK